MSEPQTPSDPTGPAGEGNVPSVEPDATDPGAGGTPPPPPPEGTPPPPPAGGTPPPHDPPPGPQWGADDPGGPRHRTPPRLTRRADDRVLCGVAGGLGDYFNVDPALFRLAFVALMFVGGVGPVLYGLGWLFLPEQSTGESLGEDLVRRAGGGRSLGRWIIAGVVAMVLIGNVPFFDGGLLWAALLIGIGVMFFRRDESATATGGTETGATTPPTPAPTPTPTAPPVASTPMAPPRPAPASAPTISSEPRRRPAPATTFDDDWRPTPITAPPEPPPPPSMLGRITVAAALILGGIVALIHSLTPLSVSVDHYAALGLAVVGAGLLVGARLGRARGLIPLGIVLVIVMTAATAAPNIRLSGDVGERVWSPTTVAEVQDSYQLGMGDMLIDLTQLELEPGERVEVEAVIGLGELTVDLPPDVTVDLDATANVGAVDALGRQSDGTKAAVHEVFAGPEGSPTIALDLTAGFGSIEVLSSDDVDGTELSIPISPNAADHNEAT